MRSGTEDRVKKAKESANPPIDPQLGLQGFQAGPEDQGLSLEELSTAYAELLQRGATPYEEPHSSSAESATEHLFEPPTEPDATDIGCDLTPKSILEAMIFVGNAKNEPLTSRRVAALMRGVRPAEIDDIVRELNDEYTREGSAFEIASVDAGYVLQLRDEWSSLRDSFYGRVREAKLTQTAIDVLAIVAYRQPIRRDEIDQVRGLPSGGVLSQLLRRGLLQLDRGDGKTKSMHYRTTDRFLQLFGLESLAELPQSQDLLPED
jgi:segregation and condensation protein B